MKTNICDHSFSNDGRYLALFTSPENDQTTPATVRVHEVQTGKMVLAFAASTPWGRIKFLPGDYRLAVVYSDGNIEVWPLPNLGEKRAN